MPIKGISEKRRINRGGYLRLGEKKKNENGREYPAKADHFIADFEDPKVQATFAELYGPEPKSVKICFASSDVDAIFPQWYKLYQGSGLLCKGDGETATRFDVHGGSECVRCPGPKDCKLAMDKGSGQGDKWKPGCKPLGSLQFFIKGLPGLQVFQINTTSWNSLVNVNSGIDMLRLARGGGSIAGIWLDLNLVPKEGRHEGRRVDIFVLKLEVPCSIDEIINMQSTFRLEAPAPPITDERDPLLYPEGGFAEENDEPAPEPATTAPTPVRAPARDERPVKPGLATDPDVIDALGACGTPEGIANALIASATRGAWGKDQLIAAVYKRAGRSAEPSRIPEAEVIDEPEESAEPGTVNDEFEQVEF